MKRIIFSTLFAMASFAAHASCQSVAGEADNIATMRDFGTTSADIKTMWRKSGQYNEADAGFESEIVDRIYSTKVKPWNADALALAVCAPQSKAVDHNDPRNAVGFDELPPQVQARAIKRFDEQRGNGPVVSMAGCAYGGRAMGGGMYECIKSPQQTAADEAAAEKSREINYRESFNRIQSIPGICTGDDCNRVVKIQRWDADTGAMLN